MQTIMVRCLMLARVCLFPCCCCVRSASPLPAESAAEKATAGGAVTETSAFVSRRRMRLEEAKKVLNIEPAEEAMEATELSRIINERYERLYTSNAAPAGSFYLQSKIFRAKEALEEDFKKKYGISLAPKPDAQQQQQQTDAAKAKDADASASS